MKNFNETFGNRACDLSACRHLPQPTAPPRAPFREVIAVYSGNNKAACNGHITHFFVFEELEVWNFQLLILLSCEL
jgi:hypothetical protein